MLICSRVSGQGRTASLKAKNARLKHSIQVLRARILESEQSPPSNQPRERLGDPPIYCGCNTLNATTINITGPAPHSSVGLNVGTPEKGTINGININQLANTVSCYFCLYFKASLLTIFKRTQALRTVGDQAISGALAVDSLLIGTWKLAPTADGSLLIASQTVGTPSIPSAIGTIMMWHGATSAIPPNWALCDGQTVEGIATPDLRDRFVVGAGSSYAPGDTGGAAQVTLTEDQMPAHNHTITTGVSALTLPYEECGIHPKLSLPFWGDCPLLGTFPTSSSVGGNMPHENRPPYYSLAYIMRVK